MFKKTRMVKLMTYTNGVKDEVPKTEWEEELFIERGEDWYALGSPQLKAKVVRVITRDMWSMAEEY